MSGEATSREGRCVEHLKSDDTSIQYRDLHATHRPSSLSHDV